MEQDAVKEKAETVLTTVETICDHCLGCQFAQLSHGLENHERGKLIRHALEQGEAIDFDSAVPDTAYVSPADCTICNGLFGNIEHFADRVLHSLDRYEFDTFLVGTRPPSHIVQAEEALWEETGVEWVEPLKSEVNRLVGKHIEAETTATVDFERPDIVTVIDVEKDAVEVDINSLCVFGRYNKYERGLPQTEWTCRDCQGKGCHHCDFEGKLYETSVEELIATPFIAAADGTAAKFHGAGREDRDAKCLGRRPFVLEVLEPEIRSLDLEQLQEQVNEEAADRIEIFDLQFVDPDTIQTVKQLRAPKTYRATIELGEPVAGLELENLHRLEGVVKQETPSRVEHRRADKTRERSVHSVAWEATGEHEITLVVKGDAGLYIKELISSDDGRTTPSVSGILGCDAVCTALDVVEVHDGEGEKTLNGDTGK